MNNNSTPKPKGKEPHCTGDNTPMHKLLAEGYNPKVSVPGPKVRP